MIIDPDCLPKPPPESVPTSGAVRLRLRLIRGVYGDDVLPPLTKIAHAPHGVYEGDDVAMNQFGAVSVRTPTGWLGVKPDEMRWLDFVSAEAQAQRGNGLAALIDHVALDAEHDTVSKTARDQGVSAAVEQLEQVRREVASASTVVSRVVRDQRARHVPQFPIGDQLDAAENAIGLALDRVRALSSDDMPF